MTDFNPPLGHGRRREPNESDDLVASLDALQEISSMKSLAWSVGEELTDIAASLRRLGTMEPVAATLVSIAQRLTTQAERVRAADTLRTKAEIYRGERMMGETMLAVAEHLAGEKR